MNSGIMESQLCPIYQQPEALQKVRKISFTSFHSCIESFVIINTSSTNKICNILSIQKL
jgi:hypothetical protein